jgi:hypothetical protein
MLLDKDMMQVKLEIEGATFYFSNIERLKAGLEGPGGAKGFSLPRNANYIIENGKFIKNRTCVEALPNTILALGRDKINELFDFMEKH